MPDPICTSRDTLIRLRANAETIDRRFTTGTCQTATVKALLKAAPDLKLPDNSLGKAARWALWFGDCAEIKQLLAGGAPKGR